MRDRVRRLAHADDFGRHLEDLPVQRLVEMLGLEKVRHAIEGIVVDKDRAQQSLFGFDVVRSLPIERLGRLDRAQFARSIIHSFASNQCVGGGCTIAKKRGGEMARSATHIDSQARPVNFRKSPRIRSFRLTVTFTESASKGSIVPRHQRKTPGKNPGVPFQQMAERSVVVAVHRTRLSGSKKSLRTQRIVVDVDAVDGVGGGQRSRPWPGARLRQPNARR